MNGDVLSRLVILAVRVRDGQIVAWNHTASTIPTLRQGLCCFDVLRRIVPEKAVKIETLTELSPTDEYFLGSDDDVIGERHHETFRMLIRRDWERWYEKHYTLLLYRPNDTALLQEIQAFEKDETVYNRLITLMPATVTLNASEPVKSSEPVSTTAVTTTPPTASSPTQSSAPGSNPMGNLPISASIDITNLPIVFEGVLASSTACTILNAINYCHLRSKGQIQDHFSALFLYYNQRRLDGKQDTDVPSSLYVGLKALQQEGLCVDMAWPYVSENCTVIPPTDCYTSSHRTQIIRKKLSQDLITLQYVISLGYPIMFGFNFYESASAFMVQRTGIIPVPKAQEQIYGSTAAMLVGYSDETRQFVFLSTWQGWGHQNSGIGFMSYDYLLNSKYAQDFWTIKLEG